MKHGGVTQRAPEGALEDGKQQESRRPAPGKMTLTGKLSPGRAPAVQRQAATGNAMPRRSLWDLAMDPAMDAAHRGVTALVDGSQAVQASPAAPGTTAPAAAPAAVPGADPGAQPGAEIDPPQPGIDKPGFIDNDDGANIRTRPAELQGAALTAQPLPPATRVFVSGQHPDAPGWWYVSAFLPSAILRGYVQGFRVNVDLPEPTAKLYQIKPGDTAERLAVQEFSAAVRDGTISATTRTSSSRSTATGAAPASRARSRIPASSAAAPTTSSSRPAAASGWSALRTRVRWRARSLPAP